MNWTASNQTYLSLEIERVKALLMVHANAVSSGERTERSPTAPQGADIAPPPSEPAHRQQILDGLAPPPSLVQLCQQLGLSSFERDIVLLCIGMELDATFASLFALLHGHEQQGYPTFGLALGCLPHPDWSVLSVASPLRRWQLIAVGSGRSLTSSPLRLDESILVWLTGASPSLTPLSGFDPHLRGRTRLIHTTRSAPPFLVPSHVALVQRITTAWFHAQQHPLPILQLCGGNSGDRRAIVAAACQQAGLEVWEMAIASLPSNTDDLYDLAQRWHRTAILSNSALLLEWSGENPNPSLASQMIAQLIAEMPTPLLISSPSQHRLESGLGSLAPPSPSGSSPNSMLRQRSVITIDVHLPSTQEQMDVWQATVANVPKEFNGQIRRLVGQFNLNADTIQAVYLSALSQIDGSTTTHETPTSDVADSFDDTLWHHCRIQSRHRMDHLAQRIESAATWDDLILPDLQKDILRDIVAHLRQRMTVYQEWGFAAKSRRGLGITALFSGISGTGKTLAAEVLAEELKLDLYKIDLSAIVSKYIGETEKNLSQVFDAAETGGAILLFDEADALFGKRNDVKDSHDRYANIEVSYLLQRMESYRGLAILTTNLPDAIDRAFLRRIRFIVQFPFPAMAQRLDIWQRMFPPQTPTANLAYKKLARLNVAGGNIRNIALNAAFIAADKNQPVGMAHLLDATRREYHKLELPLTDEEIRGWV